MDDGFWTQKNVRVITISRKRNKIQHVYQKPSAKYLGVTITSDLKWMAQHINTVVNKANSTLAFLRRNLRIKSSDLKATAYKTLVRPIVEYASSVWDPATTTKFTNSKWCRRAARFTLNRYHNTSSVNNMLSELEWPTLQKRRENVRLTMMYKIHNNLAHLPAQDYIMQATQATRNSQPHSYQVPFQNWIAPAIFLP